MIWGRDVYRSVGLGRGSPRTCRCALGLVALLGAFASCLGLAPAAAASDLLPTLVADPPDNAVLDSSSGQLLLRFNGYIHNMGPGPLEIWGRRPLSVFPMVVYQRIYQTDGSYREVVLSGAQMVYADADGHHHWHIQSAAAYSLWNQGRTAEVAPAMKAGFCLDDSEHVDGGIGPVAPVYSDSNGRDFCEQNQPDALTVWEGISAGWRDVYDRTVSFQWVDVSDVQPGVYWLREEVDPNRMFYTAAPPGGPAYAATPTTIPGYDAQPITVGPVSSPATIRLQAAAFDPVGPPQFRVQTAPSHGTLSVSVGSAFGDPSITYVPDPGYVGPDSFTYVAQDSASSYPRHPSAATVLLSVQPPAPATPPTKTAPPQGSTTSRPPGPFGAPQQTVAEIAAALRSMLIPTSRTIRIAPLLRRGGWSFPFTAPIPGRLMIGWYLLHHGGARNGQRGAVRVAEGELSLLRAGRVKIVVKLTRAGKRMLHHARNVALGELASFTPIGGAPIVATDSLALNS
jgi:Lysyl oxidase/Bacterial Ig domain